MHKTLKEQLKQNFGKEFDFEILTDETQLLLEEIEVSYKKYDEATQALQEKLNLEDAYQTESKKFKVKHKRVPRRKTVYESNLLLQQYKSAIHTSFIVSRIDLSGMITYVNKAFCKISGYSKEELIGKNQNIDRHPQTDFKVFEELWHTIQSKNIWRGELKKRAKDGTSYHLDIAIFPLLNADNEIGEYLAIGHDITTHIELQTQLETAKEVAEASEKLKSAFMANMSHEIRTPMNGIFGFTKLLKKSALNPEQERYTKLIEHSTNTLLKIIDDILDFSKIESGNLELDFSEVNPFVQLHSAVSIFRPMAKEKNINYHIHIDSRISECLLMDYLRISQVLTNLINNALKFTPAKGNVSIRVEKIFTPSPKKEHLKFLVQDDGIGIAEERIKNIFEAFIQADASTTRSFGGTGLGLSISSSLCKLMGSELKVMSSQGEGSSFYFEMIYDKCKVINPLSKQILVSPIYLIHSADKIIDKVALELEHFNLKFLSISLGDLMLLDTRAHIVITFDLENCQPLLEKNYRVILIKENMLKSVKKTLDKTIYHIDTFYDYSPELYTAILELNYVSKKKEKIEEEVQLELSILIAEDYEVNRILINEILQNHHLTPDFAMNGKEAIEMAKRKVYDLILMDINMPILDGIDATKKLRRLGMATPIIAITANALEGDKEYFLNIGMNDYISKPFDPQTLHDLLLKYSNAKHKQTTKKEKELCKLDVLLEAFQETKKVMHFENEILIHLFNSFIKSILLIIKELNIAIEQKDKKNIKRKMHGLRGILRSFKIDKLADICEKVEYSDEKMNTKEFWGLTIKVSKGIETIYRQKEKILEGISQFD
ncbi:MAG: Unknown protein [uncultured Sulfurovum sp.]|uniref:Sensory/regulatory protein RpfC n=1 Tax=uncultured Sulfurovum sp. TaxID=269237 RepID=A0A6S6SP57_9BACT|nr:MAG: Unknown protein [uncultured Sulfurovum sp.]